MTTGDGSIPAGDAGHGGVVLYESPAGDIRLEIRLDQDTVWLSLGQMSALFGRDKSVISRHLANVFREGELERSSVVASHATTAADGKTYQVDHYNLDAIISVGYRVNSRRGTQFRIWATQVLRDHILRGFSVNERRLRDLDQAVKLVSATVRHRNLAGDEARALLVLIGDYRRALGLLDGYDRRRVPRPDAARATVHALEYDEARRVVAHLRRRFSESAVFGVEKDAGLASALGAVMQTAGGCDVYPSLEEKAANLLYFLVKNHAFIDGNKRIGAALFLWFLDRNDALDKQRLPEATLVAMTLLIAESRPRDRDILVRIVTNLLADEPAGRPPTTAPPARSTRR